MNIELKPIAESKVRQLGGDVCGVLVRTEDGVMAVSEHGRCTRLDVGVMGPTTNAPAIGRDEFERWYSQEGEYGGLPLDRFEKDGDYLDDFVQSMWMAWQAARAQGGQGVEPVTEADAPAYLWDKNARYGWAVGMNSRPQPAQQGSVPHWKELEALADEYVEGYEFRGDEGDYQPNERERFLLEDCVAGLMDEVHQMLKRTTPQPEGDGWIKCGERLPTEADEDFEGRVWLCWPHRDLVARVTRRTASFCEGFWWMPTGLKRPQPPQEGEGDE